MESVPREHEKRTLFAHLEGRGVCVYTYVGNVLASSREADVTPFCTPRVFIFKKVAILGLMFGLKLLQKIRIYEIKMLVCIADVLLRVCDERELAWDNKERSAFKRVLV